MPTRLTQATAAHHHGTGITTPRHRNTRRRRGPLVMILEACFLSCGIIVYSLYLDSTVELPSEQDIRELQEIQTNRVASFIPTHTRINTKHNPNALLWIVIRSTEARLGNNMFQFASSFGITQRYKPNPVKLCIHPQYDLPHLNKTSVGPFAPYCPDHIVQHERLTEVGEVAYGTYQDMEFPPCDSEYCVFALKGYFQSYRYFEDCCASEVRHRLEFLPSIQQEASSLLESLATTNKPIIIGIHVRRGDMSSTKHKGRFYLREPPLSYYRQAMHHFYDTYQSILFVVASDDPEWCEENLKQLDDSMVILRNRSAAVDMAILASCHHVIMSRGSYGWWAGWLAGSQVVYYKDAFVLEHPENEGKVVLSDHYPPNWIGLGGEDIL